MNHWLLGIVCMVDPLGDFEFMVVDIGGVLTISDSQAHVMEEMVISTTIGMDGISLASKEAAIEESSVIIFLVDGQGEIIILIEELGKNWWDKFRVDTSPR